MARLYYNPPKRQPGQGQSSNNSSRRIASCGHNDYGQICATTSPRGVSFIFLQLSKGSVPEGVRVPLNSGIPIARPSAIAALYDTPIIAASGSLAHGV